MKHYLFDPHLFEGGAGAAGASGNSGQAAAANTGEAAKAAAKPTVVYGKQAEAAASPESTTGQAAADGAGAAQETSTKVTSNTLDAKKAEFEALINGDYRDQYNERVQNVVNRRFKETKQMEQTLAKQGDLMQLLSQKYGVDASDIEKLTAAINEDDGFWEEAAAKEGLSVSQFKELSRLRQAEANRIQQDRQQEAQRLAQEQRNRWMQEADAVKAKYPQFDFGTELQNESFGRLLQAGVPVETAYTTIHMDELMQSAMQAAANNVAAATAENIRARGQRPSENGTSSMGGVIVKNDVTKLTAADRREIARRVARGEPISF